MRLGSDYNQMKYYRPSKPGLFNYSIIYSIINEFTCYEDMYMACYTGVVWNCILNLVQYKRVVTVKMFV